MKKKVFVMPDSDAVAEMCQMLFGEEAKATAVDSAPEAVLVARFVCDDNRSVATCTCDIEFAAYSGSALSMINAEAASEFVESGQLSADARDNVREVMNLFSSLYMDDDSDHLRLISLENANFWRVPPAIDITNVQIEIPEYGEGLVTFQIH
ncbi:MAG: hypothetical protein AAF541_10445 [Pseudomonadota bacterium]